MKKILFILFICALPTLASASTLGRPANNLGLVGYWSFNDGISTVVGDSSGNGNFGTTSGMAFPATATSGWTQAGKLGGGLNFDGSNDYVPLPNNFASRYLTGGMYTVSAWVYARSLPTWGTIIKNWAQTNPTALGTIHLGLDNATGKVGVYLTQSNNTPVGPVEDSTVLPTESWQFITAVADGSFLRLYRNGVAVGTPLSYNGTLKTDFPYTNIGTKPGDTGGADSNDPGFWNGALDEVRIYSRALTATQVAALYNTSAAKFGNSQTLAQGSTLNQGLVGHWTLDGVDVQNTVVDRSGKNNTGYFVGGATSSAKVRGQLGQALDFNGITQYISFGTPSSLDLDGTSGLTIAGWVKLGTGTQSWPVLLAKQNIPINNNTGQYNFQVGEFGENRPALYINNGSWQSAVKANTALATSTWYHITATYDGTNSRIYINGVQDSSASLVTGNITGNTGSTVQIGGANTVFMNGSVDDVRVYNRALTAVEVKQLYQLGGQVVNASSKTLTQNTPLSSGLVGHWTFDGADTQSTITDKSGAGNNGYFIGGATSSAKVRGQMGQALQFNGGANYVNTFKTFSSICSVSTCSMSVWVYPTGASPGITNAWEGQWIMGETVGDIGIVRGNKTGISQDRIWVYNYDGSEESVGVTYNTNEWIHLVLVHAGGILTAYKNGVAVGGPAIASGNTNNNSGTVRIGGGCTSGCGTGDNSGIVGTLDDARIYSRALSAAEVLQLYRTGK